MEMKTKERESSPHSSENETDICNEEVMSEVHLGCPPNFSGPYLSHFTFSLPVSPEDAHVKKNESEVKVEVDEDGDLIVPRRKNKQSSHIGGITIQHNITSTIPSVGLQVWKAELVMADFVLHKMRSSSDFDGVVAVELGAGTGLVSILLARVAELVFVTDHGVQILDNCSRNVDINCGLLTSQSSVKVRELDWMKPWPPLDLDCGARYSWASSEVEEVINRASLLIAADVIYSEGLTDAFFNVLEKLMCHGSEKVLYLALEKRYNFSLSDLDIVANGYSHFRSYLRDEIDSDGVRRGAFVGKCIDLSDLPQFIREYERGADVELWEIKYLPMQH